MDGAVDSEHAKAIVRDGYNRISYAYRDDRGEGETRYGLWLQSHLLPRLQRGAAVLDLGCGNGIPMTRLLAERFSVTGVDISEVQVGRARQLVPGATFICGDMSSLEFPARSFDAVVSLFALIHIPLEEQPPLLRRISDWLKPGGTFLATVGHAELTRVGQFHGAPMYWSHADADTYCAWLDEFDIVVLEREFIPEDPHGGHELILGTRS